MRKTPPRRVEGGMLGMLVSGLVTELVLGEGQSTVGLHCWAPPWNSDMGGMVIWFDRLLGSGNLDPGIR